MNGHPAYAPYALTERLEERLGDPRDPARTFSLACVAELDRREEFPADICRELDGIGLPGYYVPRRYGGAVRTFEDTLQVARVMARRDLTTAIGHAKTFLGGVSAWVAGDPRQAGRVAAEILSGTVVSWGLTEAEHGSDLLAGEVEAVPADGGYRVTGEKWLINNAARGDIVCLLARTDPAGGARGFSLLLMDKRRLAPGTFRPLPAVRTHGIRGADISGIAFDGAFAGEGELVGPPGGGLETVLKGMQLTRTLIAGLSLGAADRALRLATAAALEDGPGGRPSVRPHTARTLAESYADLLAAEVLGLAGARAIHALPAELSVLSAVVKYYVPTSVDELIARLGQGMGVRAFLEDGPGGGLFQKVERDHRIVGIFDGNTLVNLNVVINHFPVLVRAYRAGGFDEAGLDAAVDLSAPPPEFDPGRLGLLSRAGCSPVQALPASLAELEKAAPPAVADRARALAEITDDVHERMAAHRPSAGPAPTAAFGLARDYALCAAGGACVRFWLRNREHPAAADPRTAGLWRDALWLEAALTRLLDRLRPGSSDGGVLDRLLPEMAAQYRSGLLFSPLPCDLPEDGS
ncbi:acyl-CoA dehydrogenase family protein [Actinomadura graeca]|uniref:Acyl-CoA dehydrogenase family protein n=1 Tax=Actinomadura graeca TaxID=2750812 RepID=A0ABX8QWJ8_9ACTN|nr:acyl-CoA dehydrogenase family protein [Actinomadura graeca]QXJ21822.1 acyl-CoA dehydrogenase family protein [Actinomadura graeca]